MGIKKRNIDKKYYPIERILKKRSSNGKVEYLIKWLNYSAKSNSWQPAENVKAIRRKLKQRAPDRLPIKILARFESGFCLVKWKNGKTSTINLSTAECYQIIVNGSMH